MEIIKKYCDKCEKEIKIKKTTFAKGIEILTYNVNWLMGDTSFLQRIELCKKCTIKFNEWLN